MNQENVRKRIIVFTLLCTLVLGGVLASYAFFIVAGNNTKQEALTVNTGNIALTFNDGTSGFQGSLEFGGSATKSFTIENTGSLDATVRMKWDNLVNTYLNGSLTYTLSYSETEDGEYTNIIIDKNVPRSQNPSTKTLANDLTIPAGEKYYYELTITLNYLESIDQTSDLNAILTTNFILEDISTEEIKNVMMARTSYNSTDYFWEHSANIKQVIFEDNLDPKENAVYTYDVSEKKNGSVMSYLVVDAEDSTKYDLYIQEDNKISANPNSSYLFYNFKNLESIEGLKYLDTSNVTNMKGIFYDCTNLKTLELSVFDTSKVTDMAVMFEGCSKLTSLELSNFDTGNVTNMDQMFLNCSNLSELNVSNFDTSKVSSFHRMFDGCNNLTVLDISNFDTSNVTTMYGMFNGCSSLKSLNLSNFDTSNVISMYVMFRGCRGLTSLDVTNFNTSKVTNMSGMFAGCTNLTSLDVTNFDTSNVTDMSYMFGNCNNLTTIDLNNFNTGKVTNMSGLFEGCSKLISLDLKNFNTSKVTQMARMFQNCTSLTTLNVSNFDTSNVTSIYEMFSNCTNLTATITIKGTIGTNNVGMFEGAATAAGSRITVNYTSESSSLVDNMIATKSSNSNVIKGSQVA